MRFLLLPLALLSTTTASAADHVACADVCAAVDCPALDPAAPDKGGCACEVVRSASGTRELKEVVALRVHGQLADRFGTIDEVHLAIRGADDAWASRGQLVTSWEPGAFGIHNEGTLVSLTVVTTKDLGDVATIKTKQGSSDSDMGVNAITSSERETTIYCFGHEGRPACVELWTAASGGVEKLLDDEPAPPKEYGPLGMREATRAVSMNAKGEVVIGAVTGEPPAHVDALRGRFTLAKLLDQTPIAWRAPSRGGASGVR